MDVNGIIVDVSYYSISSPLRFLLSCAEEEKRQTPRHEVDFDSVYLSLANADLHDSRNEMLTTFY